MTFDRDDIQALAEAVAPMIRQTVDEQFRTLLSATQYPEIMTATEAADFLRVDVQTIRREAQKGTLPRLKVGRSYRFRKRDLESAFEVPSDRNTTLAGKFSETPERDRSAAGPDPSRN